MIYSVRPIQSFYKATFINSIVRTKGSGLIRIIGSCEIAARTLGGLVLMRSRGGKTSARTQGSGADVACVYVCVCTHACVRQPWRPPARFVRLIDVNPEESYDALLISSGKSTWSPRWKWRRKWRQGHRHRVLMLLPKMEEAQRRVNNLCNLQRHYDVKLGAAPGADSVAWLMPC